MTQAGPRDDLDAWRRAARSLLAQGTPPAQARWDAGENSGLDLCSGVEASGDPTKHVSHALPRKLLRSFLDLARRVLCHTDPERQGLLYEALWRLTHGEAHLFEMAHDPLVRRLELYDRAVRRDIHKTHAFVRFQPIVEADGSQRFVAWFEPRFAIIRLAGRFFVERFTNMRWTLMTPGGCASWNGPSEGLHYSPGVEKPALSSADPVLDAWKTYYRSIFNPARLHVAAMQREMPRFYWKNLPEAAQIAGLIAGAGPRVQQMLEAQTVPRRRSVHALSARSAQALKHRLSSEASQTKPEVSVTLRAEAMPSLRECRLCPHAQQATQAVAGEGLREASIMLVGEQPGDLEDLQGRPFVGPAGKVLDRALEQAGLARHAVWLTNAVKHFAYEPRGKRRVHQTPPPRAIEMCRGHLLRELEEVRPQVIVCLGRTAAHALTSGTGIELERGLPRQMPNGRWLLLTLHPAYILRNEGNARDAFGQLASDLAAAKRLGAGRVE